MDLKAQGNTTDRWHWPGVKHPFNVGKCQIKVTGANMKVASYMKPCTRMRISSEKLEKFNSWRRIMS